MSDFAIPDAAPRLTSAPRAQSPAPAKQLPRRRPSGASPPLPHHLGTTGLGWLIALVAVVRWVSDVDRHDAGTGDAIRRQDGRTVPTVALDNFYTTRTVVAMEEAISAGDRAGRSAAVATVDPDGVERTLAPADAPRPRPGRHGVLDHHIGPAHPTRPGRRRRRQDDRAGGGGPGLGRRPAKLKVPSATVASLLARTQTATPASGRNHVVPLNPDDAEVSAAHERGIGRDAAGRGGGDGR